MFSFMKVMFKFYAIRFEMLKCLGFFSCFVLFCFASFGSAAKYTKD